jgi:hypothetical protein
MNSSDPFEERLARTPLRPPPSSLREQVLQAAGRAAPDLAHPLQTRMWAWFAAWLWPHPAAWATLGLAWMVVILLNVAALDSAGAVPRQRVQSRVSPAWTAALHEQRALLHSLLQDPSPAALPPEPGPDAQFRRPGNRPRLALV